MDHGSRGLRCHRRGRAGCLTRAHWSDGCGRTERCVLRLRSMQPRLDLGLCRQAIGRHESPRCPRRAVGCPQLVRLDGPRRPLHGSRWRGADGRGRGGAPPFGDGTARRRFGGRVRGPGPDDVTRSPGARGCRVRRRRQPGPRCPGGRTGRSPGSHRRHSAFPASRRHGGVAVIDDCRSRPRRGRRHIALPGTRQRIRWSSALRPWSAAS